MGVLLESKDVCKYFGGLKAVEKVNMTVNEGDIFGIIGPNGAGKTTFFNICSGIYQPTSGAVLFQGRDISRKSPDEIAKLGISRTFQNIQLFKFMSVIDNVKDVYKRQGIPFSCIAADPVVGSADHRIWKCRGKKRAPGLPDGHGLGAGRGRFEDYFHTDGNGHTLSLIHICQ